MTTTTTTAAMLNVESSQCGRKRESECQCEQIWRNFKTVWEFLKALFSIWQYFEPTLAKYFCYRVNLDRCKWPKY